MKREKKEQQSQSSSGFTTLDLKTEEGADNDDYRSLYIHAMKSPIIQEKHQKRLDKFLTLSTKGSVDKILMKTNIRKTIFWITKYPVTLSFPDSLSAFPW